MRRPDMERPDSPDLNIRKGSIHLEVRTHAAIFGHWAEYLAFKQAKLEAAEESLAFMEATLRQMERDELVSKLGKSGITEKAVSDALLQYPDVRKKMKRIRELGAEVRGIKAIISGLDAKTSMLQSYVGLKRSEMGSLNGGEE